MIGDREGGEGELRGMGIGRMSCEDSKISSIGQRGGGGGSRRRRNRRGERRRRVEVRGLGRLGRRK